MHIKHWTIISFGLVAIAASVYAAGCRTNGCNVDPDCEGSVVTGSSSGQGGSTPESCIPKANQMANGTAVKDECGVFVRLAGDDTAAGTKSKPVATLARAIELASDPTQTHRVYACAEVFAESIEIPSGIEIYGALNCAGGAWAYSSGKRTTVEPTADLIPLKFIKANESKIHIEDITARAANSIVAGGSSIAATADAITSLELVRVDFVAGLGSDGEAGVKPAGDIMPTDPKDATIVGLPGNQACQGGGMGNLGALGPANPTCSQSKGGDGGKGLEALGENGLDGVPLPPDNPQGYGLGGKGATAGAGCLAGQAGLQGVDGTAGSSADQPSDVGTFDLGGYHGVSGTSGGTGAPGQGGGGGGGAKGKLNCYGASGGSGGAGGCGGQGGSGGKAGGSSIGLISLGATLVFEEVKFTTSSGGNGGNGGDGQLGGTGGEGGAGGPQGSGPASGCAGGKGGQGGVGGKGGGGHGGHSIGIVWQGVVPPTLPPDAISFGSAGLGGAGADVSKGADGMAVDIYPL